MLFFFFSSRRRHTRLQGDWSSDVCSSDLDVITLPSWNFTPLRTLKVYVRRSDEIVQDSARSPTSLVPVRSVGSTRISVLYCGAPGWSIAKVSSWWASKLGGSAATTKISSPPARGLSCAPAGVVSPTTRTRAVRKVFMGGIILAPMKTIVALPGEGIGLEVVEATCEVLSGADVPVRILTPLQISAPGSPVPEETQRACREADAVLFGAAGPATTRVVGWLRWEMDAWAGVRPAKFYPGMRSPLADPDGIDLVVIRENSEGMYPGREGDLAEAQRALPALRDRFGRGLDRYEDGRFAVKVATRAGAARIARFACELARRRKARGHAGKVTCVTKSNVLPQTDGLYHEVVKQTVATYPDLVFEHFHVDDAARRIIRFPKSMDVVVCMNQYGDILSDVAGEVAGGLGVAPSANFGDDGWAYFESVHGSAPDIAGRGIANPTGTLLSAALMLEHLGLATEATRLEAAVARVYRDGKALTPDQRGTATTKQMTAAVLAAYRNQ